jgi:diguanylate cyclase (GGDEF)-like protein
VQHHHTRAAGVTLDVADLDALLALLQAEDPTEVQRCASNLRALLGSERLRFEAHIDALLARADELQRVRRLAVTDPLTGVANRRAFGETLRRELARAHRSRKPLAVLMFDIDDFKAINDTLSHAAGDQALRVVARTARQLTREGDLVARIGGDEFAVMLPETGSEEARAIGERIRARLASESGHGPPLRVSLGLASEYPPPASALTLLATADADLYRDKAVRKSLAPAPLRAPRAATTPAR